MLKCTSKCRSEILHQYQNEITVPESRSTQITRGIFQNYFPNFYLFIVVNNYNFVNYSFLYEKCNYFLVKKLYFNVYYFFFFNIKNTWVLVPKVPMIPNITTLNVKFVMFFYPSNLYILYKYCTSDILILWRSYELVS